MGKRLVGFIFMTAAILSVGALSTYSQEHKWDRGDGPIRWKRNGAPATVSIVNGPWTLEQSGAANGLKTAGYCDSTNTVQIGNPGNERMEPYYFPEVFGQGNHLEGFFDWRPKDTDEAVVAASSTDGGFTWDFQQEVLQLRKTCPTDFQKDASGHTVVPGDPNNADNVDDDGQGHAYVINVAGRTYLYTLVRAAGFIDNVPLVIHDLSPSVGQPFGPFVPALTDAPADGGAPPPLPTGLMVTSGLKNPDGILGVVPGVSPLTIIYEQKILNGDKTGMTALPAAQQCATGWTNFYTNNPAGTATNDDITYLRLAQTGDGINFTDLGALTGLNDPTTVSIQGTRWLATAGTIFKLHDGRFGLFFSGGNCKDGDSDAFGYVGYAESTNLLSWTVINGLNNPIASVFKTIINVNGSGLPQGSWSNGVFVPSGGTQVTIPSQSPVVGDAEGFFAGRIYAPSATLADDEDRDDVTMFFAGYHTPKPKNGLGDYRTIGRVSLHSSESIITSSQSLLKLNGDAELNKDDEFDFDHDHGRR